MKSRCRLLVWWCDRWNKQQRILLLSLFWNAPFRVFNRDVHAFYKFWLFYMRFTIKTASTCVLRQWPLDLFLTCVLREWPHLTCILRFSLYLFNTDILCIWWQGAWGLTSMVPLVALLWSQMVAQNIFQNRSTCRNVTHTLFTYIWNLYHSE
jgi:hypothetical protein